MAYKVFSNGSVLNASEINDNLMNQSVMVFTNSSTRAAALASPTTGMTTFLEDSQTISIYDGTDWKQSLGVTGGILQIVSTVKSDTFTVASTSYSNITGVSASITPTSTSSKILVLLSLGLVDMSGAVIVTGDITRAGTQIGVGNTAGSRTRAGWGRVADVNRGTSINYNFLDSPATTSSTTYQARIRSNAGTAFVNRLSTDSDLTLTPRTISTITLMEVSA